LLFILSTPLAFSQEKPFAARITFGYNDAEPTRWTGRVTADNARVAAIEGWHFLADDRISLNTFDIQTGAGLSKGITVRGTGSPGARISVETSQGTLSFLISDLRLGEEVALLEGAARVERLPDAVKLTDDFRDDDYPSIAVVDDSTAWVVWQSYSGQFDEVRISKYDGSWRTFTRLPGVSGDVWRPQVALDAEKRPWVVWSQQVDGNFDIYARALDEESNTWLKVVRLSSHPYSDIDHHLVSDDKGDLWVVWQGFHGDNSDIFLRQYNGSEWSEEVRVTEHPANDWEPRVAVDDQGKAYIVWDTYRNGNYDVYMRAYENGNLAPEEPVAMTPKFEAHASVAVDGAGRVWVAWDESGPNWAKDTGATIDPQWRGKSQDERRRHWPGVRIYESRNLNLVVLEGSGRKMPVQDVQLAVSKEGESHDFPQLLVDRRSNRIGLLFHRRGRTRRALRAGRGRAYWETAVTFYQGDTWQPVLAMPNSWGRSSMRPAAAYAPDGSLWVTWPTDGRLYINTHQPVVGNVYAAHLPLEEASQSPILKPWEERKEIEVSPAHGNEVADLTAIRRYRTFVHGVEKQIVRGDFHRHTELSWDGGGQVDGSLLDFYRYMIDAAAMDFGAVTDHFAGGGL
ncbi:hypothetical protein MYX75_12870, partial [Acidobacteria bacterium AH-259-A15]|nr:hypothetical protein [Acidobacteria bacterium AH-259-A15]